MFWSWLASFIIRQRLPLLITIGVLTVFMGWKAREVQMSYDFLAILPKSDPELTYFKNFRKTFGEDNNIIVIGCKDSSVFKAGVFQKYQAYNDSLSLLAGVKEVISIPNLKILAKDTSLKKFYLTRLINGKVKNQEELDSLMAVLMKQKIYHQQLFNPSNGALLMALSIENDFVVTDKRLGLVRKIQKLSNEFTADTGIEMHFGGIPYIRSVMSLELGGELKLFLFLSVLVSAITLFAFFRTWDAVLVPLLLIGVIIVWTFGTIALFQFKITILTGLIPSLIVITGIPNFIYLVNKYHQEFGLHQNKLKAIAQIIRSIGVVTLIVNATTAVGFLVLCNNNVALLREFGIIAGLNIMAAFVVTIIVVPSLLVYLPEPSTKKMKHLDNKFLNKTIEWSLLITFKYKKWVYLFSALLLLVSVWGTYQIKTLSFMTDDVPERLGLKEDLHFFEENFNGVYPIEFVVDTGKKKALLNLKNLKTIEAFEDFLSEQPYLSSPISVNSFIKASVQTFYGGDTSSYQLPTSNDRPFIMKYLQNMDNDHNKRGLIDSFVDSTGQMLRISCKIEDLGSLKIDSVINHVIKPKADSIFGSKKFDVKITGSTLLFVRGNNMLIHSLYGSIIQSVIFCSVLMAMLFASFRMILITLVQNFIPMLFTAAIMGFLGIHLKPSTAIIFSVVFGIAIDNSIHFLAKYRHEVFFNKTNISDALRISMVDAGPSMIYTSVILFIGFIIFTFSSFGGTVVLGILTSITLLTTLIASLTLLPVLILDFDRGRNEKDFEPIIEKFEGLYVEEDEEEVDISDLQNDENQDDKHNTIR